MNSSANTGQRSPLLSVRDLNVSFGSGKRRVTAVEGVSFDVEEGEVFAIVGESGSGKSVTAMSILGLLAENGRVDSGAIHFDGVDLLSLSDRSLRRIRGGEIAMIFQDPMTALNPLFTVGNQVSESVRLHRGLSGDEAMAAAIEALSDVGIPDAGRRSAQYPHQFSGGMRQRAVIAMAMVARPRLLIADEPTTALDVTIQAQILELLKEITLTFNTTTLLITHDLGVVAGVADRIMVMYGGQSHETGSVQTVFGEPLGPYTWGLMDSVPKLHGDVGIALPQIGGQPPSIEHPPTGCRFHPRCRYVREVCMTAEPAVVAISDDHDVRCHFADDPTWPSLRDRSAST